MNISSTLKSHKGDKFVHLHNLPTTDDSNDM